MATGLDSLISLSSVVKETLYFADKPSGEYKKFYQHAINGYRELAKFHLADCIRTVKKSMDNNYIISFPDDMLQWVRVSVAVDGEKWPLTYKRDLINTTTTMYGLTTRNIESGENDAIGVGVYGFSAGMENQYGYFVVDYENRRFLFVMDQKREVFLEYSSIGVASDSDLIPVISKDCIQAYIMWKVAFYDSSVPMNEKMLKRDVYEEELIKLRNLYTFSLDELRDVLNDTKTSLPS